LEASAVERILQEEKVSFRDRLFAPLVTLWVFLSQVLDADTSCRQAVARFCAWRASIGLPACSADASAYCKARQRLPERVLARLSRFTGRRLQEEAPAGWRWRGRTIQVVDGTTVSMPDTPANRTAYPQMRSQRPGVGFPIVRLVVLFSLAVGTVLDAAFAPYRGPGTSELALFRRLREHLGPDDVLLADRHYCSFWELALARQRGAEVVCRLHQCRKTDFRRGLRWGPGDHVVWWHKPKCPDWMDAETYATLPEAVAVRELRVRVDQPGFRTRALVVATTLLDPATAPAEELATLYRLRWQAELDLRSLKEVLQMDVLRGQTPEMVRKEIWAHFLGYNLIRAVMAQAAHERGLLPLEISFKGALQTLNAFAHGLLTAAAEELHALVSRIRQMVAQHRVGHRPDRYEPRATKRRGKSYTLLLHPREQAKAHWRSGRYD
jgi:hypothetical protein